MGAWDWRKSVVDAREQRKRGEQWFWGGEVGGLTWAGEGSFGGWRHQGVTPKRENEAAGERTIVLACCDSPIRRESAAEMRGRTAGDVGLVVQQNWCCTVTVVRASPRVKRTRAGRNAAEPGVAVATAQYQQPTSFSHMKLGKTVLCPVCTEPAYPAGTDNITRCCLSTFLEEPSPQSVRGP